LKTVALVGCGKEKLRHAAPAQDLYTSQLFRLARAWAERHCDLWGILSAKHHFVLPHEVIEPYDLTLKDLDVDHLKQWKWHANWKLFTKLPWEVVKGPEEKIVLDGRVLTHRPDIGLRGFEFVFLAGEAYEGALHATAGRTYPATFPLRGLGIGERMHWLKEQGSQPPRSTQPTLF
jgi:hypothetical protein